MTYEVTPFQHQTVVINSGYRAYYVKGKKMRSVAFYDKTGIVVQNDHGWLETGEHSQNNPQNDVAPLVLDKEPIWKFRIHFDKLYDQMQPFYSKGNFKVDDRDYYDEYTLYLPYIPDEWEFSQVTVEKDTVIKDYKVYTHKTKGYQLRKLIRSTPIADKADFVNDMKELVKVMGMEAYNVHGREVLKNRQQIITAIRNLSAKYSYKEIPPDELEIV